MNKHTIEGANEAMIRLLGRDASILGQPATTAVPELASQMYSQLLNDVFASGITHEAKAMPGELIINGLPELHYFDFTYKPLRNPAGQVYGIISTATDVTQQVQTQQLQDENQRQLLALFEQSPVGLATHSADDEFVILWTNTFYGELVARSPQAIIGKPLLEALPELKGQGFDDILKNVTTTGTPFVAPGVPVGVLRDGQMTTIYVDLTYQPRKGIHGTVESILVVAIDVTQQVLSRKAIEASEKNLQEMVIQAPIGICLLNASDLVAESVNDALVEVAGKPYEAIMGKPYWESFAEVAPYYEEALNRVVQNGEAFYANEVEMLLIRHGKEEIVYVTFVYMPLRDGAGEVKKVVIWLLENTHQVTERQKVEKLIQYRTGELATANQQLATANEELAAMNEQLSSSNEELLTSSEKTVAVNEELAQSNYNLSRSNDSLEKFAYVASHDLQEPLRKIQQFSDILNMQYGNQLGEGTVYLERMQSAASRMSTLIRDLLTFSRISTQQNTASSVPLNKVVDTVLDDLELRIKETNAIVNVDPLPVLPGDRLQLQQLFQNLLSNALKFHGAGANPVIHIGYQQIHRNQLPVSVKPGQSVSQYHQIDVTDNGVGFDEKYLDRIFQVFQRLHGRNEFAGTGIGLAICEKVVTNHGGAITASSQPGQGATFSIYLPA